MPDIRLPYAKKKIILIIIKKVSKVGLEPAYILITDTGISDLGIHRESITAMGSLDNYRLNPKLLLHPGYYFLKRYS
jgi:hypothetical protein